MPTCRSCGAEILWAETERGKRMPVDKEPVADGNLGLFYLGDQDEPQIRPLDAAPQLFDTEVRYVSHFATCPDAAEHRSAA
jgi:hypothetical protein